MQSRTNSHPRPTCRPIHNLLFVALLIALFSCGEEESPDLDNSVLVGLLLPFTGADAALGFAYERAALLAQDAVNEAGGIGGKPLVFVIRDTNSNPERAPESLEKILDLPVTAVIGPESSEIAGTTLTRTSENETTLISPVISGADTIAIPESVDWFRLAPSSTILGRAFANYLIDNDISVIAAVHGDEAYHADFVGSFTARFSALGGTVEDAIVLPSGQAGYRDELQRLRALSTANILLSASTQDAARFINNAVITDEKDRFQWYMSPSLETPVLLQNTFEGAVEQAVGIGIEVYNADPDFVDRYRARWNEPPIDGAFFYYDAVALLALSLERTAVAEDGEIPNDVLQEMIRETVKPQGVQVRWDTLSEGLKQIRAGRTVNYSGLTGSVVFKEGQQVIAPMKIWRIDGDAFVPIDKI